MNRLDAINGQFNTSASTFVSKETTDIGMSKTLPEVIDHHPSKGIKLDYFNK